MIVKMQDKCIESEKSQQVSNLLITCYRQYDLKKNQSKEGNIYENKCNYKGKISKMKDHLDNSCRLISIRQIILLVKDTIAIASRKFTNSFEELRKMNLKSNAEIENLKEGDNEKSKEIQQLKQCQRTYEEILKSNNDEQYKQITKLNLRIFYFKKNYTFVFAILHYNLKIEFEKFKKDIQSKNQINEDKRKLLQYIAKKTAIPKWHYMKRIDFLHEK
ncbi:viral A-type inclusion protein [Reticulomyxa filosa]|uniref:Viral A-type inclusion protein n=1 Tax=Reticulomyxa filosa TaxID=46433 RepID=X6NWY1_RETFI|nr:viral A-type inclusion protein [Reticulomyxa filosa]|eukprot:ETO30363.1 viral A-type inclusion protein [Reticulomyxa filosa]